MTRFLLASLAWCLATASAQAHFLFILPMGPTQARVIFSDSLDTGDVTLLSKIKDAKLFGHDSDGDHKDFTFKKTDEGWVFEHPNNVGIVCGSGEYGIFKRGDGPAMRLMYSMQLCRGKGEAPCWSCMPLQLRLEQPGSLVALYEAKPVADANVILMGPEGFKKQTKKTDAEGKVTFDLSTAPPGTYAALVGKTLDKAGELDGKKYEKTQLYTTTSFDKPKTAVGEVADDKQADPEATKLLAEARAARLLWNDFPGFTANVAVNLNGKLYKGTVSVTENGKVTLADLPEPALAWAKRILSSAVSHRLGGAATEDTPCAFADDQKDHPLGRAVQVLNDEMHSHYRIKDKQVMVVTRDMQGTKFSITMLENKWTENGKYLPASYVVNYWDPKTGELSKSEGHTQSWQRVGNFDLPKELRVVTTNKEVTVSSLTLSHVKLAK